MKTKKMYFFLSVLLTVLGCATGDVSESGLQVEGGAPLASEAPSSGDPAAAPVATSEVISEAQPAVTAAPEVASTPAVTEGVAAAVVVPEAKSTPVAENNAFTSESPTDVSPQVAAASPAISESELKTYRVRKYDTLMKISYKIYGDPFEWDDIYQLNKDIIRNPNSIVNGMRIKYKPPVVSKALAKKRHKYTIKPGDTLSTISQAIYGTSRKWKVLFEKNSDLIHNPQKIMAGLDIYYSDGQAPLMASRPRNEEVPAVNAPADMPTPQPQEEQSAGTVGSPGLPPGAYHFAPITPLPDQPSANTGAEAPSQAAPTEPTPVKQGADILETEPVPAH